MRNLQNKWVLITGAASGIGRALAWQFAETGSSIILADINEAGMKESASGVESRGGKAVCIRVDMGVPDEVETLSARAVAEAGRVDVLVNNAGIFMMRALGELTRDDWDLYLAVNLHGPVLLTHYLLPQMVSRGSGHIVNMSSMAGLLGFPLTAPYCTTKFGMLGFSESLRAELHHRGIGVTAVCPAIVLTPMIDNLDSRGIDLGLDPRHPPRLISISVEKAAAKIVAGVRRNQALVVPAPLGPRLLPALKRLSPRLCEQLVKRTYGLMESRRKRLPGERKDR